MICFALVGGAANYFWVNGAPTFGSSDKTMQEPVASDAVPAEIRAAVGAGE